MNKIRSILNDIFTIMYFGWICIWLVLIKVGLVKK